jgi:putative ABC transport system permease protein
VHDLVGDGHKSAARVVGQRRLGHENVVLLGAFAGLALILASVGIYGVVAYSVTQRTRELGLRMAIGAQQRDVVALVLRESLIVVAVGMAVGVVAALLATRALSGFVVRHRSVGSRHLVS